MKRTGGLFLIALVAMVAPQRTVGAAAGQQSASPRAGADPAFVKQYCVTCHNERNTANVQGFALDAVDAAHASENPDVWEKVIKKVRGGLMPPAGARRPEKAVEEQFVASLEAELDRRAATQPDPGRTEPFHRLNRTEYRNVVRDLLALDIDVKDLLPADAAGGGHANFDNIAASLRISESLLDRYLSVAQKVGRAAIGTPPPPISKVFKVPANVRQDRHRDGLPLGSRGGILIDYTFPVDAEYEFKIDVAGAGPDQLEISIDGVQVKVFALPGTGQAELNTGRATRGGRSFEIRLPVKAGPRDVVATFPKMRPSVFEEADRLPFIGGRGPLAGVDSLSIRGPFVVSGPGDTPARRKIFVCRPQTAAEEEGCARQILGGLARRAYRRPVTPAEVSNLLAIYKDGRADGGFEAGVEAGLQALLANPSFLVRVETEAPTAAPGGVYRISNLELASRLSFFLWSSIPDDELLDVAISGRLTDPVVLRKHTRRMLADPRAEALTTNFAAQWLYLRNLEYVVPVDQIFPNFDEGLRQSLFKETTLFVDSVRRENRSILDLLDADYTFVDERAAVHYGIPGVHGSTFQRVTLPPDSPRRGLLGKGSVLLVTSVPQRTSPVLRGKWILENILGTPPPPPPPGVPPLGDQKQNDGRLMSVRDLLTQHRANAFCSNCHSMIDPPGFALEGFDAIGRVRKVDATFAPIDTSGVLPDGSKFSNLAEFRGILLRRPQQFARTFTEKLLTFALGRGLAYYDAPPVRQIVRESAKVNYSFSSIVQGIVESTSFRMRKALPATSTSSASR